MAFSIVLAVGITVSGFSSSLFLAQISLYILANQILYISSQLDACHARAHAGHRHSHLPEIATGGRRELCLITTVGHMGGNRAAAATPVHALTPWYQGPCALGRMEPYRGRLPSRRPEPDESSFRGETWVAVACVASLVLWLPPQALMMGCWASCRWFSTENLLNKRLICI